MKIKKQKKGVSLIVLVITIIVMIILASAIIISLSNNGIIDSAKNAVDKTNESEIQELASLAWADAYTENVGKSDEELLPLLKASVEKALSDNNLDKEDYGIVVTTTGVTVAKGWLQTSDRTVVKGDTVLNIGADISYDETNGGTVTVETDVDWKVLGAENGELLIMSVTDVKSNYILGSDSDMSVAQDAYENGVSYLNEICEPYGHGVYATGARCITVEDVDRVTGYDKTRYEKTFENGSKVKYGDKITYSWDSTDARNPYYKITSGTTTQTGNMVVGWHSSFTYHNGKEWVTSTMTTGDKEKDIICTLTQTGYFYDVSQRTDLAKGTDAYSMLFGSDDASYWLASPSFSFTDVSFADFSLFFVRNGDIATNQLVFSQGYNWASTGGVRAVVRLSPEYNP